MANERQKEPSRPAFAGVAAATQTPRNVQRRDGGFWHRPDWMNLVADVLLLVASVAIGYAAVKAVLRAPWFALHEVVIVSPIGQVTAAQLEYAAASSMRGNFFTVDLDVARQAFEKLPWVRSARLRRHWPGRVEVSLQEHTAVAYWRDSEAGDMRLINSFGEIFDAASNAAMPVFSGPADAGPLILERRRAMDEMLKPMARHVVGLVLSNRQAWQLKLDDGMIVELGRDQNQASTLGRLERFVAAYPQARALLGAPVRVADLRYPSGFAVSLGASEKSFAGPH